MRFLVAKWEQKFTKTLKKVYKNRIYNHLLVKKCHDRISCCKFEYFFLWFFLFFVKNEFILPSFYAILAKKFEVTKMLFSKKNQAKNFKFSIVYTMMFSDAWKSYIYSNLMSFFQQFFMKILSKMSKFLLKIRTCT